MRRLYSERTEVVDDTNELHKSSENKTRILLVDGHPEVRHGLIRLIDQQVELGVCVEVDDPNRALEVIEGGQVDLAIVDISLEDAGSMQLTEKIKLQCPCLPILILSMSDETVYAKRVLQAENEGYVVNEEATEQIIKAIRYIQSLLRSGILGFTVLLKLTGSSLKCDQKR